MKVYMVHYEHGQYSDFTYKVCGMFSSKEKAKEFLRTIECRMHWDDNGFCGRALSWETDENCVWDHVGPARLVEQPDGRWVLLPIERTDASNIGYELEYFITEYEMDVPVEDKVPDFF